MMALEAARRIFYVPPGYYGTSMDIERTCDIILSALRSLHEPERKDTMTNNPDRDRIIASAAKSLAWVTTAVYTTFDTELRLRRDLGDLYDAAYAAGLAAAIAKSPQPEKPTP